MPRTNASRASAATWSGCHECAPRGRDLDDLAIQAADDSLVAILAKLDQFRRDALFTTGARRFTAPKVPGEICRRLGHTREAPTDPDHWPPDQAAGDDPQQRSEACELARTVGRLIAHELTAHQREVLVALTIDAVHGHSPHFYQGECVKMGCGACSKRRQGRCDLEPKE